VHNFTLDKSRWLPYLEARISSTISFILGSEYIRIFLQLEKKLYCLVNVLNSPVYSCQY